MASTVAIVGLGSNLGSREAFLRQAARLLGEGAGISVDARSSLYPTPPVGPPQPDFLNAALRVRTTLAPDVLLARMQAAEARLGRVRTQRWGPRTVDLDLLWWSGGTVATPALIVPHPRLAERAFALAPLLDVAPELTDGYGEALARAGGAPAVRAWSEIERIEDGVAVAAADDADALALASAAWSREAGALGRLEVGGPAAFVAAGGRLIQEWAAGALRGLGGGGRAAREVRVEGGGCVIRG